LRRTAASLLALTLSGASLLAGCGESKKAAATSATPSLKWTLKIGAIHSPLALGPDGTLYALLDSASLMAIDPATSRTKWTQPAARSSSWVIGPAVGTDGAIYILAYGKLIAFNPDGSTRIEKTMNPTVNATGMALTDKSLYCDCVPGVTCAWTLDQGMNSIWRISSQSFVTAPIIQADGTIVLAGAGVFAVDSGMPYAHWTYPSNGTVAPDRNQADSYHVMPLARLNFEGLAAGKDGATYATGAGLIAFDANGQQKWNLNYPPYPGQQPVVAADGTVYYASHNQHFYAVRPDGTIQWSLDTTALVGQPLLGSAGTIFFTDYKTLRAISPDGKEKWKTDLDIESVGAATLSDDGTLYIASRLGTLYAFPVGETLMQSPWPKFQANARNSGQANP
jgi:outer membrane protein assembly factor BamB